MANLEAIIRHAVELVLEACVYLEIPPESVRIVFWSSNINGEVINSGSASHDIHRMNGILFGGEWPLESLRCQSRGLVLILGAGGTDYDHGLWPFSEGEVNVLLTGTPRWAHCAAMRG